MLLVLSRWQSHFAMRVCRMFRHNATCHPVNVCFLISCFAYFHVMWSIVSPWGFFFCVRSVGMPLLFDVLMSFSLNFELRIFCFTISLVHWCVAISLVLRTGMTCLYLIGQILPQSSLYLYQCLWVCDYSATNNEKGHYFIFVFPFRILVNFSSFFDLAW